MCENLNIHISHSAAESLLQNGICELSNTIAVVAFLSNRMIWANNGSSGNQEITLFNFSYDK